MGEVLVSAGLRVLEVPLNTPDALVCIAALAGRFSGVATVGAGTVLRRGDVGRVAEAGGTLVVMPHGDPEVIAAARGRGMAVVPGVATPTEAFAALAAGADALKLFPGESLPPVTVKAWRAVLPADVRLIPTGGVTPEKMADYWAAGARGFGIGSALFKPGAATEAVAESAKRFVAAARDLPQA